MQPIWLREGTCNHNGGCGRERLIATCLVGALLGLCATLAITGCTAHLKGVSGPIAWQATDLRVVERVAAGTPRDIYAFTLVLAETQGSALTLTYLEQTVSQPDINSAGVSRPSAILWKLRPHGELRQPFSFYWYCDGLDCQRLGPTAPWYDLVLTGTNDQGQPVRITINLKLPPNPPKLKLEQSKGMHSTPAVDSALPPVIDSGPVPFQTVNNLILIHAILNRQEHATLVLDTGATHTFLTPDTAKRLGLSPGADAPKRTSTVIGGRQVEFSLVQLASLAVGAAVVENVEVGVLASFQNAPLIDGILGGGFLKHFSMTLDYATSRLQLVPKETALAQVGVRHVVPIQIVGNHVLVRALLNHQEQVTLLLDTGASHTILTPGTAQRLGISPMPDAPRRTLRVADGQLHEVPLIQLAVLAVGNARVENLQVGVSVLFPQSPTVGGLLGGDFLEQFKLILDRTARQMWLESR